MAVPPPGGLTGEVLKPPPKPPPTVDLIDDLVKKFWEGIKQKTKAGYDMAKDALFRLKNLASRSTIGESLEEMEAAFDRLAADLKIPKEVVELINQEKQIPVKQIAAIFIIITVLIWLFSPKQATSEELSQEERKKRRKEALAKLPPDESINPVAELKRRLQEVTVEMRRKCPCAHPENRVSQLGGNPAFQLLAFQGGGAPLPIPSGSGGGEKKGPGYSPPDARDGGGGGGGGGRGGRSDPLDLPSRGGRPLPKPSDQNGGKGDTLPYRPPSTVCRWPDCPSGTQGRRRTG